MKPAFLSLSCAVAQAPFASAPAPMTPEFKFYQSKNAWFEQPGWRQR